MKNLTSLLEKFSNLLNKDTQTKELIIKTIQEKSKISLNPGNIHLKKDGLLEIKASPIVNNEIRLKEDLIKDGLRNFSKVFISRIIYK